MRGKLDAIGLPIAEDVAGNLWATVQGQTDDFLIVGSHIDAVPEGGWLDGVLGLMTALETVRQLAALQTPPPVSVRFVDWADEEGARFTRSLVGSSACAGTLVPDDVRNLRDSGGLTLVEALANYGVDLDQATNATTSLAGAVGYLELHIEQGPILLESGRVASAVSGTFGVERHLITFMGQSAHAGSTPMNVRRDTLAAAAQATLAIRESGIARCGVATVGNLASTPGVITAVAGRTEMQLDQRHLDPAGVGRDARRRAHGLPVSGRCVRLHAGGPTCFRRHPHPIPSRVGRGGTPGCCRCRRRWRRADPKRPDARRN